MFDRLLRLAAPHQCVGCCEVGGVLCQECRFRIFSNHPSTCYRCNQLTKNWRTCTSCRSSSPLFAVYAVADYGQLSKELIKAAKFDSSHEAARVMGAEIADQLPLLPIDYIVPVPTAPQRQRARGFNQALIIAKEISVTKRWAVLDILIRINNTKQVGANIETRKKQLEGAIRSRHFPLDGKTVLLVDDVVSTGASLEASAKILKQNGAKRIYGAVFARNL